MFHTAAFTATMTSATLAAVQALTDSVLTITGTGFRLVGPMQLMAAAAMSATLTQAQLTSPTLRIISPLNILPIEGAVKPSSIPKYMDLSGVPFNLPQREEIDAVVSANAGGGGEVSTVLIWVTPQFTPAPPGQVYWVKLTSTTAAVANAWTNISLTFAQSLPSGYYSVVGSFCESTNAIAHRLLFPGQVWRPGALSVNSLTNLAPREAMYYYNGEYGRFVNDNPFQCEVLVNGTDNSHTLYVALVPVASM